MGTATVLANSDLRDRLVSEPALLDVVTILEARFFEPPDVWLLKVRSVMLPAVCPQYQEIIVEGNKVRFKPYAEV